MFCLFCYILYIALTLAMVHIFLWTMIFDDFMTFTNVSLRTVTHPGLNPHSYSKFNKLGSLMTYLTFANHPTLIPGGVVMEVVIGGDSLRVGYDMCVLGWFFNSLMATFIYTHTYLIHSWVNTVTHEWINLVGVYEMCLLCSVSAYWTINWKILLQKNLLILGSASKLRS